MSTSKIFLSTFGNLESLENLYLAKNMGLCDESDNIYVFFDTIHKIYNCYIEAILKHAIIYGVGIAFFQNIRFGGNLPNKCLRVYLKEHGHFLDTLPEDFQLIIRNYCNMMTHVYE